MTLFTLIWLLVVMYCFMQKGMKPMLYATLIFMTFQCANAIVIGNIVVGPQVLTSILFVVKYVISYRGRIKIIKNRELTAVNILMCFLVLEIVYSSLVNGNLEYKLLNIIQLSSYMVCYVFMRRSIELYNDEEIYTIVRNVIIFVAVVGVIQWLTTMHILPIRSLLKPLIYNDDSLNVYFNYDDRFHNLRVYAMFMEPSYLAGFLVGGFYYLFSFRDKWKSNIPLMILILAEILLSTSSTAYGALVIVGLIFVLYSKQISLRWKLVIIAVAVIGFCILYFGFYNILDAVIFSKSATGSGKTRARWNLEAMAAYRQSPIWGVGYKSVRGSSIVCSLLGELGVVGLVLYFSTIFAALKNIIFVKKKLLTQKWSKGYYAAMFAVLSVVICQMIACPDLDMCTLWLCMYILAIYEGMIVKYKRETTQYG